MVKKHWEREREMGSMCDMHIRMVYHGYYFVFPFFERQDFSFSFDVRLKIKCTLGLKMGKWISSYYGFILWSQWTTTVYFERLIRVLDLRRELPLKEKGRQKKFRRWNVEINENMTERELQKVGSWTENICSKWEQICILLRTK